MLNLEITLKIRRFLIPLIANIVAAALTTTITYAQVKNPIIIPVAESAGINQRPFITSTLNLSKYDFVEQEFFMSGTANRYTRKGLWHPNGLWETNIIRKNDPYKTRLLVRRPADPENFNGIVVVEWLNNTAFMDVDVIWAQSHTELLREGYTWIGVSAQFFGVNMLKSWDKQRYGTLRLPSDALSYDIFSQAARAVRNQSDILLGGLTPEGIIAAGESQSAIRLSTYVNAFQADAVEVYDAMLIYSRFHLAAPLRSGISMVAPPKAYIRDDNQLKIIQFETEQDLFMFNFVQVRQEDTDFLRTWELPGASHYDDYGVNFLLPQYQRDFPALSSIKLVCRNSLNKIPQHYVVNAALSSLSRWVVENVPPPKSPTISYQNGEVVRDEHGNAKGGIRLPELEVPTATHNYANIGAIGQGSNLLVNLFACPFLGNTVEFKAEKLNTLYSSHDAYVLKYIEAADNALAEGFLLQPDYDEAIEKARVMMP
ncbi:MAG: hypothetical protein MI976_00430 [Pseudomonadales bacterium]|nr:hypothetical protein [Pseudomonadales bacterium]